MKPRAIFFGTPDFAVPTLRALCEIADVRVVISQPDRRSGRGMKTKKTPTKLEAEAQNIEVWQPTKVRTREFRERLIALEADVAVVVAYGRILPLGVLEAPRYGCVNVHASLLPKLRGAAPIQWSLVRGHRETGVSLMKMDEGMDTGPIISVRKLAIEPGETAGELSLRLSALGGALLKDDLPKYLSGELTPTPQDHSKMTMAPLLSKADGEIRWETSATAIHDRIRGLSPWPSAFTALWDTHLKVHRARAIEGSGTGVPGTVTCADQHGIEVSTGDGILVLEEVQLAGKRRMSAKELLSGTPIEHGTVLGASPNAESNGEQV